MCSPPPLPKQLDLSTCLGKVCFLHLLLHDTSDQRLLQGNTENPGFSITSSWSTAAELLQGEPSTTVKHCTIPSLLPGSAVGIHRAAAVCPGGGQQQSGAALGPPLVGPCRGSVHRSARPGPPRPGPVAPQPLRQRTRRGGAGRGEAGGQRRSAAPRHSLTPGPGLIPAQPSVYDGPGPPPDTARLPPRTGSLVLFCLFVCLFVSTRRIIVFCSDSYPGNNPSFKI